MKKIAASLSVFVLWSLTPHAQTAGVNDRIAQLSALTQTKAEYRLGAGDLIEITVFGVPNFSHNLRISSSGMIKLPLLEPLKAAGQTPAELEESLAAVLDGELIRNPQVSVFVKEYRSQPVFILGAIRSPGQYMVTLQLNIIDVVSMAGGLQPNAGDEAVIQRRNPDTGAAEVIKVDLKALVEDGDLSKNVPVSGGDVINIQERPIRTAYVIGEVNRSGAFQLPPKLPLRVSQAIASAGGPQKTAKMSDGILVRYDAAGVRQELPVNFDDILKGKKEDFLVHPDDIIFVPGSKFKSIGYGLLNIVPGALAQVPYAIAY